AAERAREALSGGDGERSSHAAAGWGAVDAAGAARHALDPVRAHDEGLAALADRLAELTYLLADISADLSSYAASVESDPARLAAVSNRRAELGGLTRKYGDTVAEVLAWAENSAARLLVLEGADDRVAELSERRQGLRRELAGHAAAISAARSEAAVALARQVTAELGGLAMPHAALSVVIAQQADAGDRTAGDALMVGERRLKFGPHGVDDVEFMLAANAGSEPRSLARGASGGELSRIMLALEVVLAETASAPTFVFDEVDAGVGGKAAVEVGRRLAQLAKTAQVVVVTHLPQVAAFADRHVAVRKADDGLVTSSGLESLDDAGRERELSRMLAGLEDSSSAREHARELLATARADQG
ncbi:MAG: DNA repair protein RecN, partial [Nocardioides sp.]